MRFWRRKPKSPTFDAAFSIGFCFAVCIDCREQIVSGGSGAEVRGWMSNHRCGT